MHNTTFSRQSSLLADNGNKVKVLNSVSERTLKVAWNPKNHKLAFGGENEMAYLWDIGEDIEAAKKIATLPHSLPDHAKSSDMHEKISVNSLDWNPAGNVLATGSSDGFCRLWGENGDCQQLLFNEHSMPLKQTSAYSAGDAKVPSTPGDFDTIHSLAWNKDGSALVTTSDKHNVALWKSDGKMERLFQGHTEAVLCVDWKNNNQFATSSQDGVIKLWDVDNPIATKTFNAHENSIKCIKWDH